MKIRMMYETYHGKVFYDLTVVRQHLYSLKLETLNCFIKYHGHSTSHDDITNALESEYLKELYLIQKDLEELDQLEKIE